MSGGKAHAASDRSSSAINVPDWDGQCGARRDCVRARLRARMAACAEGDDIERASGRTRIGVRSLTSPRACMPFVVPRKRPANRSRMSRQLAACGLLKPCMPRSVPLSCSMQRVVSSNDDGDRARAGPGARAGVFTCGCTVAVVGRATPLHVRTARNTGALAGGRPRRGPPSRIAPQGGLRTCGASRERATSSPSVGAGRRGVDDRAPHQTPSSSS